MTSTEEAQGLLLSALGVYKKAKLLFLELPGLNGPRNEVPHGWFEKYKTSVYNLEKLLNYAVEDLLHARNLNLTATIRDGTNIDCNELTARILLLEALAWLPQRTFYAMTLEISLKHGLSVLQKYLTYKPQDDDALLLLAKTYFRQGNSEEARTTLEEIRSSYPQNFEARKLVELMQADIFREILESNLKWARTYSHPDILSAPHEYTLSHMHEPWTAPYPRSKLP